MNTILVALGPSFSYLWVGLCTYPAEPYGRKWSIDGFLPCHNSYGVAVTLLLGTRLRMYAAVSNASPQKTIGRLACDIIDLIMSSNVRFLCSAKPFCCGVRGILSCHYIPFSSQNSLNISDRYSWPRSVWRILTRRSNWVSTLATKRLNTSSAS